MNDLISDALEVARLTGEPVLFNGEPVYAVVASDAKLVSLERYRNAPARRRADVQLSDAAAFAAYVGAYRGPDAAVFADVLAGVFVGVLDYHAAGEAGAPAWAHHRATLKLAHTPEWRAWAEIDGKPLEQSALADFLEDHIGEIADPAGATLVELARVLTVTHGSTFVSTTPGASHTVKVSYTTDERAAGAGDVTLPTRITLGIAPFEGTDRYRLGVRLRVVVSRPENRPAFVRFVLTRIMPDRVTRDAAAAVRAAIAAELGAGVRLFDGTLVRGPSREADA